MAGEIRERLHRWQASKKKLLDRFDALIDQADKVHGDTGAIELAEAELRATSAELAEFQAEFAAGTNGPPAGPLPGSGPQGSHSEHPVVDTGHRS